jgi:hypothetical protein
LTENHNGSRSDDRPDVRVTSGKVWRQARERGIEVTFRSGHTARIRPIGLDLLVRTGRVPSILESYVVQMIERGSGELPTEATLQDEAVWFDFLDCLCELAFVAPRVVAEPMADDEISVADIDLSDKMELWEVLGAPARLLADHFRSKQESPVAAVAASEAHAPTGEPDPGHPALGQPGAGHAGRADGADV